MVDGGNLFNGSCLEGECMTKDRWEKKAGTWGKELAKVMGRKGGEQTSLAKVLAARKNGELGVRARAKAKAIIGKKESREGIACRLVRITLHNELWDRINREPMPIGRVFSTIVVDAANCGWFDKEEEAP